jgi:hypothetical protein
VIPFSREAIEVEALRTDRYLDALLAQHDGRTVEGAALAGVGPGADATGVEPAIRSAIDALDRTLLRVHPSFRFEERLARRLAEVADAMRLSEAAGAEGAAVPVALPFDASLDPAAPGADAGVAWGTPLAGVTRPLLIGALSLAGAVIVVWRLGRPLDPMARAVRAAGQLRGVSRAAGVRLD